VTAIVPRYDELPLIPELGARHSWGVFGDGDQLGTANFLTAEAVVAAAREIVRGERFNLSLPLDEPRPGLTERPGYRHTIVYSDRNTQDDVLDSFHPQGSSQWDGLRHVRAREYGFYNGTTAEQAGSGGDRLGIEAWAERGIVGRGVLLDVAGYLARRGTPLDFRAEYAIGAGLLRAVAVDEGVALRAGDILLIRTGYVGAYLRADPEQRRRLRDRQECPGLAADAEMARFLWDGRFAAVAADNHAVECQPGDPAVGFLHRRLIPLLGFAMGEWFALDRLALDCAEDGRYTCFFAGLPLNLPGGVGSPANSIAIK
jgi:kynurenine formamidase